MAVQLDLEYFGIKVANFKCFDSEEQGFDRIAPLNIIIGKNNSGKSSLLDLLPYLTRGSFDIPQTMWNRDEEPKIIASSKIPEEAVRKVFRENERGMQRNRSNWEFGSPYVDTMIRWQMNSDNGFVAIDDCPNGTRPLDGLDHERAARSRRLLVQAMPNPLAGREFRRIFAERNITPEKDNGNLLVSGNGDGTTNIIQNFINNSDCPSSLVEKTLLEHLNRIFSPDAEFTDIVCQRFKDGYWEIYLEEEHKGRIALSQSGSGLKTIIIVLVHLLLLPHIGPTMPGEYVYGFEELENNLHPALLRRLLRYLLDHAKITGDLMFLTTHSSVGIDFFGRNKHAQIIHVTHDGKKATCRTTKTYIENCGVLDDLDLRASDLLQSNCIIWVEGPSDRIYITRWIELFTDGQIEEGYHYQCVFYGGRLLAHLSSKVPEEVDQGIAMLTVNRNSCIVMDSDKRAAQMRLNETKRRIESEVTKMGGTAWITKGKEIENYLPAKAIGAHLGVTANQIEQYEDFSEYLNNLKADEGKSFLRKKPLFAEKVTPHLTSENALSVLDLREQIELLCKAIRRWNGIAE